MTFSGRTTQYEDFELADGVYELPNGKTLKVWSQSDGQWACVAHDHGPFCRRCQHISDDPIQVSLVSHVIDGNMLMEDHAQLGWRFSVTPAGKQMVGQIMARSGRTTEDLDKMSRAELRVFLNGPTRTDQ